MEIVHKENIIYYMKKGSVISMLKIVGLKKVAGESKYLNKYKGEYLQLNYDMRSGKVWTDFFCSFNESWKEYHDSNVINCGNISEKVTMQDVREIVENAVKRLA